MAKKKKTRPAEPVSELDKRGLTPQDVAAEQAVLADVTGQGAQSDSTATAQRPQTSYEQELANNPNLAYDVRGPKAK